MLCRLANVVVIGLLPSIGCGRLAGSECTALRGDFIVDTGKFAARSRRLFGIVVSGAEHSAAGGRIEAGCDFGLGRLDAVAHDNRVIGEAGMRTISRLERPGKAGKAGCEPQKLSS
jgi:hypothetical protein